jgi:hypothetical protein
MADAPGSLIDDPSLVYSDDDDEHDGDLQVALALSLQRELHGSPPSAASLLTSQPSDDEDAALRAALALSLQDNDRRSATTTDPSDDKKPAARESSAENDATQKGVMLPTIDRTVLEEYYKLAQPYNLENFHVVMWDTTLTTDNDKIRWIQQGMHVRAPDESSSAVPDSSPRSVTTESNRLEQLASSFLTWGLVQQHGGPCGVLAAVQAEMIKYLVWGTSVWPISHAVVVDALARSIGTILARAALSGPAAEPLQPQIKLLLSCRANAAPSHGLIYIQLLQHP